MPSHVVKGPRLPQRRPPEIPQIILPGISEMGTPGHKAIDIFDAN